jgi:hypothetical protein
MPEPNAVDCYLDALARELSFDPALSRRVRKEVEDHLWESTTNETGDTKEPQHRAIERFGNPREIALQYAALSALSQVRRVAVTVVVALAGIFIAMKGRAAWYGLVHWGLSNQTQLAGAIGVSVTRFAFMVALVIGVFGCAYIVSRRIPTALHRAYCTQMKRCTVFCALVACALLTSVAADVILTALHLLETEHSAGVLIPMLSTGVEMVLLGALIINLRLAFQRSNFISSVVRQAAH